jgi:UPF0148 protein
MALTAELIRKGATILQEPCPRCGSVQIKFKGKTYCTNEDDLNSLLAPESERPRVQVASPIEDAKKIPQASSQATDSLKKLLDDKLSNLSKQLDSTTDIEEQAKILELISKYLETLEKLKRTSS